MDSSTISAISASCSAVAAAVTAIVAIYSLVGSRRDSRDRTRPVVVATFEGGPSYSTGNVYLVVRNDGQSSARNVQVRFSPPLPDYEKATDGAPGIIAPFLRRRYDTPIGVLAPRQELANIYSYTLNEETQNVEPVKSSITLDITYQDDRGRSYNDSFPLDLKTVVNDTRSEPSEKNDPTRRTNRALEAIAWEHWRQSRG